MIWINSEHKSNGEGANNYGKTVPHKITDNHQTKHQIIGYIFLVVFDR